MKHNSWPELSFGKSKETYETIHLWTQIIGKIKLELNPWINHSWHTTLNVTTHGLSSGPIFGKDKQFEIILNFLDHQLEIVTSANENKNFDLKDLKVASCYHYIFDYLQEIGIDVQINSLPNEIENPIPFHENNSGTYDIDAAINLHKRYLKSIKFFISTDLSLLVKAVM